MTDVEKFLESAVKLQPVSSEVPQGIIDDLELTGDALVTAAVAKGKELGYELTNEEVATWIAKRWTAGTNGEISESDLDDIADAFKQRDKWWGVKRIR